MEGNQITVVYKWTARPEKLGALTDLYKGVTKAMEENEPGATAVHVFVSEDDNAIYVRDEFADANALGLLTLSEVLEALHDRAGGDRPGGGEP